MLSLVLLVCFYCLTITLKKIETFDEQNKQDLFSNLSKSHSEDACKIPDVELEGHNDFVLGK